MSILEKLWWKFMPGEEINVVWPVSEIRIRQEESGIWDYVRTADPNDHYRPWLEENVGKQGWDWDWVVGPGINGPRRDSVLIKFRIGKTKFATIAAILWV